MYVFISDTQFTTIHGEHEHDEVKIIDKLSLVNFSTT